MRILILALIAAAFSAGAKPARIIRSGQKEIVFFVNGDGPQSWTISPHLKPDRLEVECTMKKNTVKFFSNTDSASFTVQEGDTVQFYVLYNGDSALTEITTRPKNVNFTAEYIKAHKGKIEIAIPEVHELVNIAMALTPRARKDSNMVNMETPYYAEVIRYFDKYKNHPLIDTLSRQLAPAEEGYWYYYAWKMSACAYSYDKNKIRNNGYIKDMGFSARPNPIPANIKQLEDFATVSGFRKFYKDHLSYYKDLKTLYVSLNPIEKMQQWLQQHFNREYGSYAIYFSPLIGGAHSTERFSDNGFSQTVMFICPASEYKGVDPRVNEMLESRVVFTEIDHNFVNPVSDKYLREINNIINRPEWADTSEIGGAYNSSYSVFNEYMTWAVFSLYCMDNYPGKQVDEFVNNMERQMVKSRGFIRFKEFNRQLMSLYEKNRKITIDELYKEMIAWCAKQK